MFVGMPLVPLLCLLYGDPMLKKSQKSILQNSVGPQANNITVQ